MQSDEMEPKPASPAQTALGKSVGLFISSIEEVTNQVGFMLMGELWLQVSMTIQDAFALSILQKIPELIFLQITGNNFQDFGTCIAYKPFISVSFYACCVIVSSKISFWILLAARTAQRFSSALRVYREKTREES